MKMKKYKKNQIEDYYSCLLESMHKWNEEAETIEEEISKKHVKNLIKKKEEELQGNHEYEDIKITYEDVGPGDSFFSLLRDMRG